jgi:hypothetical protein
LPILLYGYEIWGYFNTLTARFRNESIPLDTVYSKIECEKLHSKFSKRVRGVHQTGIDSFLNLAVKVLK